MGKKPFADVAKTDRPLRIRLTDGEREILDAAAARAKRPTSTWARDLLLAAAARQK